MALLIPLTLPEQFEGEYLRIIGVHVDNLAKQVVISWYLYKNQEARDADKPFPYPQVTVINADGFNRIFNADSGVFAKTYAEMKLLDLFKPAQDV